ncbi:acyltransferase family protein [Rhizobium sp. IMFF44]|uniref:acyltransferase family protein n=1 Tax=Rhizobium sp. IMFF44 TaxID=3342350 RepID=UPI0035BB34E7
MSNKVCYSLQAARGVAASMVVACHLVPIQEKYVAWHVIPSALWFGQAGVDVFFVVSGFVMAMTTDSVNRGIGASVEFIWRRLIRILPPYWFYSLLLMPVFLVAPQLINSAQGNHIDLFRSFLLLPSETLPLLTVGWTLVFEMWFYLVFAVLLALPRGMMQIFLAIWAAVLASTALAGTAASSPTMNLIESPFALEFIAGCAGYFLCTRSSKLIAQVLILTGVVGFVVSLGTWPLLIDSVTLLRALSLGISISLVLAGAVALERETTFLKYGVLRWAGDISYSVYLCHILVLSLVGRVWAAIGGGIVIPWVICLFWTVAVGSVIGVGAASFYGLERPSIAFLKRRRAANMPLQATA